MPAAFYRRLRWGGRLDVAPQPILRGYGAPPARERRRGRRRALARPAERNLHLPLRRGAAEQLELAGAGRLWRLDGLRQGADRRRGAHRERELELRAGQRGARRPRPLPGQGRCQRCRREHHNHGRWVRFQPPVSAKVYTSLPAAGKRVALTFDDGGGKTAWYWILRELIAGHAQGTFFPIGEYVADYANRDAGLTLKDHMAIGSHSWSHPDLTTVSDAQVRLQLKRPDDIWWQDFHASTVPYLRPPYGAYNAHLLALAGQMGYSRIILWDVDSLDWTKPGVNAIVANVLDHVHDGSIILMHTRGQTPKALPLIIAGLHARGYQMVIDPRAFQSRGCTRDSYWHELPCCRWRVARGALAVVGLTVHVPLSAPPGSMCSRALFPSACG